MDTKEKANNKSRVQQIAQLVSEFGIETSGTDETSTIVKTLRKVENYDIRMEIIGIRSILDDLAPMVKKNHTDLNGNGIIGIKEKMRILETTIKRLVAGVTFFLSPIYVAVIAFIFNRFSR